MRIIRGVLLLECDNLESSKKRDEMRRRSLMENWLNGFLARVKCFSAGHLLAHSMIYVTLYVPYIYGRSKILIRKK